LISETDTHFTITVSHPTRINDTIIIILDRIGCVQECQISSYINISTTNVIFTLSSLSELLGTSVNVSYNKSSMLF